MPSQYVLCRHAGNLHGIFIRREIRDVTTFAVSDTNTRDIETCYLRDICCDIEADLDVAVVRRFRYNSHLTAQLTIYVQIDDTAAAKIRRFMLVPRIKQFTVYRHPFK